MIWKESYKIGVKEVDEQHKELFKRLNNFIKTVRNSEDDKESKRKKVAETLDFMGDYVDEHFSDEEKLQKKYNYPDYEKHHEIHEKFKAEIKEFAEEFKENEYDEEFAMEFSGRLLTWLINHVADTDQKIGKYINKVKEERGEK